MLGRSSLIETRPSQQKLKDLRQRGTREGANCEQFCVVIHATRMIANDVSSNSLYLKFSLIFCIFSFLLFIYLFSL